MKNIFIFWHFQVNFPFRFCTGSTHSCWSNQNKVVAILLGAEGMGIIGIMSNAMGFIKTGAGLGICQSAVRDVSEAYGSGDKKRFSHIICITRKVVLFTSFLGLAVTIIFSSCLSQWGFGDKTYTLSFIFLSIAIFLKYL